MSERCPEYEVFKQHVKDGEPFRDKVIKNETNVDNLKDEMTINRTNVNNLSKKIDVLIWKVVGANIAIISLSEVVRRLLP